MNFSLNRSVGGPVLKSSHHFSTACTLYVPLKLHFYIANLKLFRVFCGCGNLIIGFHGLFSLSNLKQLA